MAWSNRLLLAAGALVARPMCQPPLWHIGCVVPGALGWRLAEALSWGQVQDFLDFSGTSPPRGGLGVRRGRARPLPRVVSTLMCPSRPIGPPWLAVGSGGLSRAVGSGNRVLRCSTGRAGTRVSAEWLVRAPMCSFWRRSGFCSKTSPLPWIGAVSGAWSCLRRRRGRRRQVECHQEAWPSSRGGSWDWYPSGRVRSSCPTGRCSHVGPRGAGGRLP
jgi:hypothetical protein